MDIVKKEIKKEIYNFKDIEELKKEVDINGIIEKNSSFFEEVLNDELEFRVEDLISEFLTKLDKYKTFKYVSVSHNDFTYELSPSYSRNDKLSLNTSIFEQFINDFDNMDLVEKMGFYFYHRGGGICNFQINTFDILQHNDYIKKGDFNKLKLFMKLYDEFLNKWVNTFYQGDFNKRVCEEYINFHIFEENNLLLSKNLELLHSDEYIKEK